MTPHPFDAYLHAHIPLSRHLGLRVLRLDAARVEIHLPLAPNLNPHGTVFGGSLNAVGLLTGWVLLHQRCRDAGLPVKLVGQQSETRFLAPAVGDCIAHAEVAAPDFDQLAVQFRQRGRARHELDTVIRCGDVEVARHRGTYALLTEPHPESAS